MKLGIFQVLPVSHLEISGKLNPQLEAPQKCAYEKLAHPLLCEGWAVAAIGCGVGCGVG